MPKFSAYMRGEEGPQGDVGQAALIDGIVDAFKDLPQLSQEKNLAYYVKENNGLFLYTSLASNPGWHNQGSVTIGFSTYQPTNVQTLNWNENATVSIEALSTPNTSKSFKWNLKIPHGREAGFTTSPQIVEVQKLQSSEEPYVNIEDTNSPFYAKQFKFKFGIPAGVAAGFSTNIGVTTKTVSYTTPSKVRINVDPTTPETSKKFNFEFDIQKGEPAGFGTLSATVGLLDHLQPPVFSVTTGGTNMAKDIEFQLKIPQAHPARIASISTSTILKDYTYPALVSATATGLDWEKHFQFNFQIPQGRPGGFANEMGVSVSTLHSSSNAIVTVIPDETTPDYAKKFNFHFAIPHGEAADFGAPIISVESLSSHSEPIASVIASGGATTKVFNFHFGIPKGLKGDTGDALAIYEPVSFTSGDPYWNGNSLHIQRGEENKKVPLFIFNNNKLNIAATFKLTDDEIIYDADEKFDGTIYLVSKTNKTFISINSITTVSYNYAMQHPNELITENIESTSSDILWDIKMPIGPVGGSDDTGWQKIDPNNDDVVYRKIGDFVYLNAFLTLTSEISANSYLKPSNIPTIPANLSPLKRTALNCTITGLNGITTLSNRIIGCELLINSNGSSNIVLYSGKETIPGSMKVLISGFYLIN